MTTPGSAIFKITSEFLNVSFIIIVGKNSKNSQILISPLLMDNQSLMKLQRKFSFVQIEKDKTRLWDNIF